MNIAITSTASKNNARSNIIRSDSSIPSGNSPHTVLNVETPNLA